MKRSQAHHRGVTRDTRVPFTFRTADEHGVAVGYMSARRASGGSTSASARANGKPLTKWERVGVSFALRLTPTATAH